MFTFLQQYCACVRTRVSNVTACRNKIRGQRPNCEDVNCDVNFPTSRVLLSAISFRKQLRVRGFLASRLAQKSIMRGDRFLILMGRRKSDRFATCATTSSRFHACSRMTMILGAQLLRSPARVVMTFYRRSSVRAGKRRSSAIIFNAPRRSSAKPCKFPLDAFTARFNNDFL